MHNAGEYTAHDAEKLAAAGCFRILLAAAARRRERLAQQGLASHAGAEQQAVEQPKQEHKWHE